MERLTEDSVTGETYIKQCASSCPYDGDFCGTDECPVLNAVADKLGEYERAEEQGLLVRLPCKVGTEVFCFFPGDSHYTKCQIKKIEICPSIFGNICYFAEPVGKRGCCCRYFDNEFGKFLFLTLEEAEKKLEEMKKWKNLKKNAWQVMCSEAMN